MGISKKTLFTALLLLLSIIILIVADQAGVFSDYLYPSLTVDQQLQFEALYQNFILLLVYIFAALFLLTIWGYLVGRLEPRLTKSTLNTLRVLGRMLIIPFCAIAYLNTYPAFQGTLLGISAILGTAIGFASSTTIGNFLAGLYIMAARPFLIGDYVILPDIKTEGRVKEVSINYTKLTLPSGNDVLISNGKIMVQTVINTRLANSHTRRFDYPLVWGTNSDEKSAWSAEAIKMTAEQFKDKLTGPVTWFVVSRTRLDTSYQITLTSDSATKLLSITSDFMTELTQNYDTIKAQTGN